MRDRRQKNQLKLAFLAEDTGEARRAAEGGTESLVAKRRAESPADTEQLMEEVCERENCKQALARVKANKGSPGVDGMTVRDLPEHLKQHWPTIREQLLNGTYQPQPVKRVEIPKPDGGVRKLGIPTVLDRFIQQAVMRYRGLQLPIKPDYVAFGPHGRDSPDGKLITHASLSKTALAEKAILHTSAYRLASINSSSTAPVRTVEIAARISRTVFFA
jgi:hypothetical protein